MEGNSGKQKWKRGGAYSDMRTTREGDSIGNQQKLNPKYQGPFCVSKVFPNHMVEILSYNGNGTQLTHVNRLKALAECMIWRDEECVDFDHLQNSKLKDRPMENQKKTEILMKSKTTTNLTH